MGKLADFLAGFFSSRRRHTRLTCDWSSDVCSSDLAVLRGLARRDEEESVLARVVGEQRGRELVVHAIATRLVTRVLLVVEQAVSLQRRAVVARGQLEVHRRLGRCG